VLIRNYATTCPYRHIAMIAEGAAIGTGGTHKQRTIEGLFATSYVCLVSRDTGRLCTYVRSSVGYRVDWTWCAHWTMGMKVESGE
jgi:amino acid permease